MDRLLGNMSHQIIHAVILVSVYVVGDTVSDFGLPWDLLAEIDFLV